MHFKHEQSQVLSPDSPVTIDTIHQTQDAATCFEFDDRVVGTRIDQQLLHRSRPLRGDNAVIRIQN